MPFAILWDVRINPRLKLALGSIPSLGLLYILLSANYLQAPEDDGF
jgi:hypothetical protein